MWFKENIERVAILPRKHINAIFCNFCNECLESPFTVNNRSYRNCVVNHSCEETLEDAQILHMSTEVA